MARSSIQQNPSGAYVYAIIVDGIIRYIGKGSGDRLWQHARLAKRLNQARWLGKKRRASRFHNRLAKALRNGADVESVVLEDNLSNDEAFAREVKIISTCPRSDLWNETLGGEGQTSEYLKSIFGAPEVRAVFSDKAKRAWRENPERKHARFAYPGSKQEQREMALNKWRDQEYRERQSVSRSKPRPTRRGVVVPKLSIAAKTRWKDESFRQKAIAAMKESVTAERKQAISARLKSQWSDPQYKARVSASIRAAHQRRRDGKIAEESGLVS